MARLRDRAKGVSGGLTVPCRAVALGAHLTVAPPRFAALRLVCPDEMRACVFGRTLAAFTGGLMCGFLWEFWNYWALTKWTYNLPFLGSIERYKYFEMPLPGLLGFLPFGIECWIMWQLIRIPLDGLAEPLPDDHALL